ncbi:MAG: hypothetical protein ACREXX_02840 [Gammaproteobacteria bacterium]
MASPWQATTSPFSRRFELRQQFVAARFEVTEAVGAQADCYLQSVYEHFGLHRRAPKHFFEHPALQDPGAIGSQRAGWRLSGVAFAGSG